MTKSKCFGSLFAKIWLRGRVVTKDWISEVFQFLKGKYQGDPYSSSIFLMVFEPLIDFIMSFRESNGYKLGNSKVLSNPFADDFDRITNHIKKRQKLMLEVQVKAQSMGLTFKPSKCRSLSSQAGKVTDTKFFLLAGNRVDKVFLKTMEDGPHKFLGSYITERNTPADYFAFLKDKLKTKLANLDKTEVRGEYKIAVYSRYILPSLQFHFSMSNIHKTHLDILDGISM